MTRRCIIRGFFISLLVAIAVGVTIALAIYTFSPRTPERNYFEEIKTKLAAEPRFKGVDITVKFPEGGGGFVIGGEVKTNSDLAALHALVEAVHPPYYITWHCTPATPPFPEETPPTYRGYWFAKNHPD